jgi:predicted nucleotidyltransferase
MTLHSPDTVTTVADARAGLSATLKSFRQGAERVPVILGSHRKAEAVLLPFSQYQRLIAQRRATETTLDRVKSQRKLISRIAELNNVGEIAIFGSVARGTDGPESDVDLLVESRATTSLFDLAQLEIDLEQLFGRPVQAIDRSSLDAKRDANILAEAVTL